MTTALTQFNQDGIEIYINTNTGESFASIKGYARMANVAYQAIQYRLKKGGKQEQVKEAEIPTKSGIQWGKLLPESTIAQWLPQDNPDLAHKFLTLGIRAGMHWLAGYDVTSTVVEQYNLPQTYTQALEHLLAAQKQIEADKPKVEAYERLINSNSNVRIKDFADTLGIKGLGRNNLMKLLRSKGVFTQNETGVGNTPYRRFQESGYFEVNEKVTRSGNIVFYTVITPKGQDWLLKKLREWGVMRSD